MSQSNTTTTGLAYTPRAAPGSFSHLAEWLAYVQRIQGKGASERRGAAVRQLFADTLRSPLLQQAHSNDVVFALLQLLIPDGSTKTRAAIITSTDMRNTWLELVSQPGLLPTPVAPVPQANKDLLQQWPNGSAEKSIHRFRSETEGNEYGTPQGIVIADVSNVAARTCPFVYRHDVLVTNPNCNMTILRAADLVRQLNSVKTSAQRLNIVRAFATDKDPADTNNTNAKPRDKLPLSLEWQWFTRVVLQSLYIRIQEATLLRSLHPAAKQCADLQRNMEAIAHYYTDGAAFPNALKLGTPFRPQRCQRASSFALLLFELSPQYMQSHVLTSTRKQHLLVRVGDKLYFRHAYMREKHDVQQAFIDPLRDLQLQAGASPVEGVNQHGPALLKTYDIRGTDARFNKKLHSAFHQHLWNSIFSRELLDAIPDLSGFQYILLVRSARSDPADTTAYEEIPLERVWHLFRNGLHQLHASQTLVVLPTLPLRVSRSGRASATRKPSTQDIADLKRVARKANHAIQAKHDAANTGAAGGAAAGSPAAGPRGDAPFVTVDTAAVNNVNLTDLPSAHGFFVEQKYDGERIQFHLDRAAKRTFLFTRGGYDWTDMYATIAREIRKAVKSSVTSLILDGELLVYDKVAKTYSPWGGNCRIASLERDHANLIFDGNNHAAAAPDSVIMTHDGDAYHEDGDPMLENTHLGPGMARFVQYDRMVQFASIPGAFKHPNTSPQTGTFVHMPNTQLCYVAFDILHIDGCDLVHMPLLHRRKILEDAIPPPARRVGRIEVSAAHRVHTVEDVLKHLTTVVNTGGEGLVAKNPFTAYMPGLHVHWQKIKPNCDDIDMAIVGFGFQVARDLSSSGNPHVSSFTVAVRDPKPSVPMPRLPKDAPVLDAKPHELSTVCETPYLTGDISSNDKVKVAYMTHPTSIKTQHITDKLNKHTKTNDFIKIEHWDDICTLYAKKTKERVTLVWVTAPGAFEFDVERYPNLNAMVYYDSKFTNIQVVAHPFLFPNCMAVRGDYRIHVPRADDKTPPVPEAHAARFTSAVTIRFPVGTLRAFADKHPVECDTLQTMKQVAEEARTSPLHVILQNIRRAADPIAQAGFSYSEKTRETMRRTTDVLGASDGTQVRTATDDSLLTSLKRIPYKWPTRYASRDGKGAGVDGSPARPPGAKSPKSNATRRRRSSGGSISSLSTDNTDDDDSDEFLLSIDTYTPTPDDSGISARKKRRRYTAAQKQANHLAQLDRAVEQMQALVRRLRFQIANRRRAPVRLPHRIASIQPLPKTYATKL